MSRKAQLHEGEMAEVVLQPVGIMGDTRCPRCGTRFQVDFHCENGHAKPTPTNQPKPTLNAQNDPEFLAVEAYVKSVIGD